MIYNHIYNHTYLLDSHIFYLKQVITSLTAG